MANRWGNSDRLYFGGGRGSKVTADIDYNHEIKGRLLLGRKAITNLAAAAAAKSLQSCPILCDPIDGSPPGSAVPGILQARTLEWVAIAFRLVKAMVFPVVIYGCESWTIKKAEHQRIDVLNCGVGEDS